MKYNMLILTFSLLAALSSCPGCTEMESPGPGAPPLVNNGHVTTPDGSSLAVYPLPDGGEGVPVSAIYKVNVIQGTKKLSSPVYQSSCPEWVLGFENMVDNDKYPLNIYQGNSISWTDFSFSGEVEVEITVLDRDKVPASDNVKIFPSRYGVTPTVEGDVIRFKTSSPGQFSVEIGDNGYKNGLMIFANPAETDAPSESDANYLALNHATALDVTSASAVTGLYFKPGVHDIGAVTLPANVKNVYLEGGAYVYGSIRISGSSDVRIFGRGVLSQGRMNYRQAHCIEAIDGSDRIKVEGITVANNKYFSIRLIGTSNKVEWTKVIGGWTYNADGISAYANSTVSHCFIWANDDNIKCYETGVSFTDIVCWQLNNGGVIQMNWGNGKCDHAEIRRVDILHASWNSDAKNRGVISCVGNKYYYERGGIYTSYNGWSKNWIVEDVVTETTVPLVMMIAPYDYTPMIIEGLHLKDWKILYNSKYGNQLVGATSESPIKGVVFENFTVNGVKLTSDNYKSAFKLTTGNLQEPIFK